MPCANLIKEESNDLKVKFVNSDRCDIKIDIIVETLQRLVGPSKQQIPVLVYKSTISSTETIQSWFDALLLDLEYMLRMGQGLESGTRRLSLQGTVFELSFLSILGVATNFD
ncbi:hypothetical protein BGZ54_008460 [Gamsiella multidivaricata]|nr:hypothetical protein BGZ54_008460 [Gamsiella multidivaricata]